MGEWWTYRPEDFLLFSEQVYWRQFELHNAAQWPWPVLGLLLGGSILGLALVPRSWSDRLISVLLLLGWVGAAAFLWDRYQTINWAAAYVAPLFAVEALLVGLVGGVGGALSFGAEKRSARALAGWAMFLYALAIHPLTALVDGRSLQGAEIFAVAPDPTAIATLGLLAAAYGGRAKWMLVPIPLIWLILSWATLQTLGTWEAWILVLSIAAAVLAFLARPERRSVDGPDRARRSS